MALCDAFVERKPVCLRQRVVDGTDGEVDRRAGTRSGGPSRAALPRGLGRSRTASSMGHSRDSARAAKPAVLRILRQPEAKPHDLERLQISAVLPLCASRVQICVDLAAVRLGLGSDF